MDRSSNLHIVMQPLEWLIGKWPCDQGLCQYPTFSKTLFYNEELEIAPVDGQPCLTLKSISRDNKSGRILHQETGFIRFDPNQNGNYALILAHMNGMTEISEGTVDQQNKTIEFISHTISGTSFGPCTKRLRRSFKLVTKNELEQVIYMETVCTSETEHCRSRYTKK